MPAWSRSLSCPFLRLRTGAGAQPECCDFVGARLPAISHTRTRRCRLVRTRSARFTAGYGAVGAPRRPEMSTKTTDRSDATAKKQREELEQAEKNANPNQFREENEES